VILFEFWENDGENHIKRTKGVDGADVSYPGADGGEVGGSSRRERYSVPGTAPLRKRSVVSFHFSELVLVITVLEMRPLYGTCGISFIIIEKNGPFLSSN